MIKTEKQYAKLFGFILKSRHSKYKEGKMVIGKSSMTERENLLRVINGQEPAWVPRLGLTFFGLDKENPPASEGARIDVIPQKRLPNGGHIDMFGIEFEPTNSTGGMELPVPGKFILDDITKWRDVIKLPSLEGIDWEAVAKKSVEHIDRNQTAVVQNTHVGYFQHLMNFMGFTEGLCAMYEEPEEVRALYEYLSDFYMTIAENTIDYIKPDIFSLTDDTATAKSSFISLELFRDLVKPYHARLGNLAKERGIPVNMHNCGRCEDFIEDWMEYGVKLWNPAQVMNDLEGIKKK